MKARIEATLTLEETAEHFEQWRRHKGKGERIPEQLWNEAVGLVSHYGITRVARTLRLSGTDLSKRRGTTKAGRSGKTAGGNTAFVEMDPVVMDQAVEPSGAPVWMELERGDGMRLRIRAAQGIDLLGLVERFMQTRSCCS